MIHDIVIIIWEDHVYDQEILVIYDNTIVQSLVIDVEPMDIIICVVSPVYTLSPAPGCCYRWNYFHVELRENQ